MHWHAGVSETYPIEALKSNAEDGEAALALDANASLWVGLLPQGPGQGLEQLEKGRLQIVCYHWVRRQQARCFRYDASTATAISGSAL